jgi:hypothetical protein
VDLAVRLVKMVNMVTTPIKKYWTTNSKIKILKKSEMA